LRRLCCWIAAAAESNSGKTTGAIDNCVHGTAINCNTYADKLDVYVSGGPTAGGIKAAGDYYFAVIEPGSQHAFLGDGTGDLSLCGNDPVSQRTFTVGFDVDGNPIIDSYAGTTHGTATNTNGKFVIDAGDPLNLYCDTSNGGGVYILAICSVGATSDSQCKFDAFKAPSSSCEPNCTTPFGVISGAKYHDANANGIRDGGEVGIANWAIDVHDGFSDTLFTGGDGSFSTTLTADDYTVLEEQPTNNVCVTEIINNVATLVCAPAWIQSGNAPAGVEGDPLSGNQASSTLGNDAVLNGDKTYSVHVVDGGSTSGLNFGNVCVGRGGGLMLGFWSNKNGKALFGADDLALMVSLNLRNANGTNFDPASYAAFRTWLLGAKATNMAYMLSAQLAAMELNVFNTKVSGTALIYAPGTTSANASGFATVNAVMSEANTSLGSFGLTKSGNPERAHQEALKTALDRANNNLSFVQGDGSTCPAPTFG
jgi:hypothetical protein